MYLNWEKVAYMSLRTGPFALGTPPFSGGADMAEKPLNGDPFFSGVH